VDDEAIRTLLARLPRSGLIPTEPGMVAVLRSRVIEAGGDAETVTAWVERQGGYSDKTLPKARGKFSGVEPDQPFYAIPRDALKREGPPEGGPGPKANSE
jgi:hypothetical protein